MDTKPSRCHYHVNHHKILTVYTKSCIIFDMRKQSKMNRQQWDSERIRALRRHLGVTQHEMADTLGTRQQTISEWEKGMYQPRGASSTLLTIVAERAKFTYKASLAKEKAKKP